MSAVKEGAGQVAEKVQRLATPVVEAVTTKKVSYKSKYVHIGVEILTGLYGRQTQGSFGVTGGAALV